jgi:RNA polymerase sigma-70 factor (ECF subfamily)
MLAKRHTALPPHWAAARHARSAGQPDGSSSSLADPPALERLAAEAREGDRNALQELASLLQPSVWRFAYHLSGSREVAEEACQETWARVIRALPSFRAESSITTWLLAIARRVTAGLLADQRRHTQRALALAFSPPPSPCSTASIEIELELDRLPAHLREALILTQVVGLTYEESALLVGVKVGTIRSRVFRARTELQRNLRESTASPPEPQSSQPQLSQPQLSQPQLSQPQVMSHAV